MVLIYINYWYKDKDRKLPTLEQKGSKLCLICWLWDSLLRRYQSCADLEGRGEFKFIKFTYYNSRKRASVPTPLPENKIIPRLLPPGKIFCISACQYTITIVMWTEHLSLQFHNHISGDINFNKSVFTSIDISDFWP